MSDTNAVNLRALDRLGVGKPIFPGAYTARPPYFRYTEAQAPANFWDRLLAGEIQLWSLINASGGIKQLVARNRPKPLQPLPFSRLAVQQTNSIALPPADGLDYTVLSFTVPFGYYLEISSILHLYTGNGFVEGSGDLAWRLILGNHYAQTMGNMLTSTGSGSADRFPIQEHSLIAMPGETVQYVVNFAVAGAGNLAGGRVLCQVNGYYYPKE